MESSNVLRVSAAIRLLHWRSDCRVGGLLSWSSSDLKTDGHVLKPVIWGGGTEPPGMGIISTPSGVHSVVVIVYYCGVAELHMSADIGFVEM